MSVISWSVDTTPGSLTVSKVTDLKNGVNNALDKDGSVTPTANLAMGGYGITNIGAGGTATISITDSIAALTGKDLTLNAPTGQAINLQINGVTKAQVDASGNTDLKGNKILNLLSGNITGVKYGTYVGDGTDGRNITLGFIPDFVLVMPSALSGDGGFMLRGGSTFFLLDAGGTHIFASSDNGSLDVDSSDGFIVGKSTSSLNLNLIAYAYLAVRYSA